GLCALFRIQLGVRYDSFDSAFHLYERPERHHPSNGAVHQVTDVVSFFDFRPGIGENLTEPEAHTPGIDVHFQDHHIELLALLQDFRRMVYPRPRHLRNMEKSVDAPEIDECTVVRYPTHDSAADLVGRQTGNRLRLPALPVFIGG